MTPSRRLKLLTFVMRHLVKPKLRRTATPEAANKDFERAAPFIFSTPRGTKSVPFGNLTRVACGPVTTNRAIFYVHGGAFLTGSPRSYRAMAGRLSKRTGAAVYLTDYPLLQDAPFPAAPQKVRADWDALIASGLRPDQVAIVGDSAGGNLALGLLSDLLVDGIRPAAGVFFSPWADLTLSGETLQSNRNIDPLIPVSRMEEVIGYYLDGADAADPRASPLFAAFPSPPPTLLQVGADEVLLSDAERMAAKLGSDLRISPHVPHVWQIFDGRLPEANAAMREVAVFLQTSFDRAKR